MFTAWPLFTGIRFSLLDWSGIGKGTFTGLSNFVELFSDQLFWNAFGKTFQYMSLYVPLEVCLSLLIAYILNMNFRGAKIFRTVFFLPVVTTAAIVGIIMIFIFGTTGPANSILQALGIIQSPINFVGDKDTAMVTLVTVTVWKSLGIYMIYWLAALQSVPKDVYEAAAIDGAGKVRMFFSVVFPLILPIGGMITILCIIHSLKVFDMVQTMTGGGPFFATDVISTFVYRTAFDVHSGSPRVGYACAAGILFGLAIILIGVILNKIKALLMKNT